MKVLLAASLLLAGSMAQARHVDSKGREWLNLTKTLHFSANEVRNVCSPICNGRLGAVDVTGYTWANEQQVLELMKDFEPTAPTSGDVPVFATASSFAQALGITFTFNTTYSMNEHSAGLTSSADGAGRPLVGAASYGHAMVSAGGEFAFYAESGAGVVSRGVWLVKGLTPPPPPPPANCSLNGESVPYGSSITRYQSSTVPYGQTCQSEVRTCSNNGVLSGTFTFSSCSVLPKPLPPAPPKEIQCEQKNKAEKAACKAMKKARK